MAQYRQKSKLRILTLLLAVLLVLSFSALLLTACSKDEEEDDPTTPSKTDTQTFPNADLEFFDDGNGAYLIGSPKNWTSSTVSNGDGVSSSSSVAKSGIVNTAPEAEDGTALDWGNFLDAYNDYVYYEGLEDDDPALEDAEYYTDIDNYYDIPGWDIADAALEGDETLGDDAIRNAAKAANPGTHWAGAEDAAKQNEEKGTNVLMLHNYRTNGYGTATQYTSSSLTLAAGTAARVSVWVKTYGLTYNDGVAVDGNRGAFISVLPTVGGSEQDAVTVRNIDTQKQNADNADNGWVQYTFYLKAATYSDTSFTLVLGLGRQASGIHSNYYEYVQGYAFFDDITYETMTAAQYAENTAESSVPSAQNEQLDLSFGSDDFKFDAARVSVRSFAYDLDSLSDTLQTPTLGTVNVEETADEREQATTTFDSYFKDDPAAQRIIASADKDEELGGLKTLAEITEHSGSYTYAQSLLDGLDGLDELPFYNSGDPVLLLYSSEGLPYTAVLDNTNVNANSNTFTLGEDKRLLVSFWVKTSDLQGGTGATITLVDADNETAIGALDTSSLTGVTLKDDVNEDREDIYGGWQLCAFSVSNPTEEELSFSIEFSFGPTAIAGSTVSSYAPGYAAFTAFRTATLSEEEAGLVTTGTYTVAAELAGDAFDPDLSFDQVSASDEANETSLADLRNYTGVFGGSTYVGGAVLENGDDGVNKNAPDQLATAGLLNKKYADKYTTANDTSNAAWLDILQKQYPTVTGALTSALWNDIFGADCTQPLLIANAAAQSYGYIATGTSSFAASGWSQVTLRVKLSPGATANVYLIDTAAPDDEGDAFGTEKQYTDAIAHATGLSYRYDEDGNVVNLDPDDEDFEQSNILFHMQDNGLWTTGSRDDGNYFANLANYERDEDGNLVDTAGDIVYYIDGETYYRYKDADTDALSVAVRDFTAAGVDLTGAVMQKASEHALTRTVTNTGAAVSGWIYVRFFVETGDMSKSYRLEVWSGDRTGAADKANPADSFVIFDIVSYGTLDESTFDNRVNGQITALSKQLGYYSGNNDAKAAEALLDAYKAAPDSFMNGITKNSAGETIEDAGSLVYYRYSLYDDADYAPYDENYTDSGNPYADYAASSYSDTLAYLSRVYTDENGRQCYDTYVNYAASDVNAETATDDDADGSDDSTAATADPDYNVWLLAASIVLAAVLVFTLIALLARKIFSDIRKKSMQKATPAYSNKRGIYVRKLKQEEEKVAEDDVLVGEDEEIPEDVLYNERTVDENGRVSGEELEEGVAEGGSQDASGPDEAEPDGSGPDEDKGE